MTDFIIAFDWGAARMGVAVAEASTRVATPRAAILEKDKAAQIRLAAAAVREAEAATVLVGLPLERDGEDGPTTRSARMFAAKLEAALASVGWPATLHLVDERFTSAEATTLLRAAGARPTGRDSRSGRLDSAAAAVLLAHWLDRSARAADASRGGPA
jgi:putative Holliday junction resolvase